MQQHSQTKFTFLKIGRSNPCPICGGTKTNCRITEEGPVMCIHNYGPPPAGYKLSPKLAKGYWPIYFPSNQEKTEAERTFWLKEQADRQAKAVEAERIFAERVLSPEARNEHFQKLLDSTTLGEVAKEDLTRRGVSLESCREWGVRSVDAGHDISALDLPIALPGVSKGGRSLYNRAGYLCPAKDPDGLITGFQVRLDGGGYRWLSSPVSNQDLPNHENPITVAMPLASPPLINQREGMESGKAVGLCEGLLKPFVAAQRLGQTMVGAAGGMFAHSSDTLKDYLVRLKIKEDFDYIVFYPDAGAIKNPSVLVQYFSTFELVKSWGFSLKVFWYGQESKYSADDSSRDIDEISREELQQLSVKLISVDEFKGLSLEFAKSEIKRLMSRLGYRSVRQAIRGCGIPYDVSLSSPDQSWRLVMALNERTNMIALSAQLKGSIEAGGFSLQDPSLSRWLAIHGGSVEKNGMVKAGSKHLKELIAMVEAAS